MYLNDVPYGGTAIGVEAAAGSYFGKEVSELDLAESVLLQGFLRARVHILLTAEMIIISVVLLRF